MTGHWVPLQAEYQFGGQVVRVVGPAYWEAPVVCAAPNGAWPENADFPLGYDERDAKGV